MKAVVRDKKELKYSGVEWIGNIPHNWQTSKVKYLVTSMGSGGTPDSKNLINYDTYGTNWVTIADITKNECVKNTINHLSEHGLAEKNLTIFPKGTILYAMYASVGKVGKLCKPAAINQAILGLIPKDNINHHFFMMCLKGFEKFAMSLANGNTQYNLNAEKVKNIHLPEPSITEQNIIAEYLNDRCAKIDAIIAEVKASIEEYKELKQAVIYEAVTKGLDKDAKVKNIASIWVDNIPVDWKKIKIHHLVSMPVIDGPHVSPELVSDGIPYISANAIENGKINFDKKRGYITHEYNAECQKRYKPQKNDILVVKLGATTGKMAMVEEYTNFNIWVPLAVVRCKKEINAKFVFFAMQSEYFQKEIQNGWTYGTQETLGVKTLDNLYVFIPPKEEQDQIVDYLEKKIPKFDELISEKQSLIENLEAYKKSLIYEVVTGKRKVVA